MACDPQMKTAGKGGAWAEGPLGQAPAMNVALAPAGSLLESRGSCTFLFSCVRGQGRTPQVEAPGGQSRLEGR